MEEHEPFVSTRGFKKHRSSDKVLPPDQEFVSEQDDTGKEMVCTFFKEIKHYGEISDPVGGTVTQEYEDTVDEDEDKALNSGDKNIMHTAALYSQAGVEEEINFDFGSTSVDNYSCDINTSSIYEGNIGLQFGNTTGSGDNNGVRSMVTNFPNRKYDDAGNPFALEKEPAAVSKNIVVKYLYLALIINSEYMRLIINGEYMRLIINGEYMRLIFLVEYMLWQEGYIFPDCQINAAAMGTKSCIFCTACFATNWILLYFILAQFCCRCMVRTSLLNALVILFSCQLSRELLAIGASKDTDDNVCCVFCTKEVPVKNAGDLKKGQHLTRPGQSRHSFCFLGLRIPLSFPFYRHHLFLKDIVFFPDQTAMLTFIHMTKCGRLIDIYETVESCNVPDENLNVVQYNNPKYPPEEIIDRAESSVNFRRKAKPDSYNLFFNNCESVIRDFMVGSKISLQALFYFEIIANILMSLFCIASLFMSEYIGMFTFVAFLIYCILFSYLAMDLSTYCKKDKIICESHLKYIKIMIFCRVTFWTLFIFFIILKCSC